MKLAVAIYNLKQLEKCVDIVDTVVLNIPHFAYIYEDDFDIDKAINLSKDKDIILAINRIFMEHELDAIKQFIVKHQQYKFLVSDLGVVEIFRELNLIDRVIYDPDTLICNSNDLSLYQGYGFDSTSMSNEITINDVITSYHKTNANIFYQVFGRKLMFYSKRKLLSLYEEYRNLNFTKDNLSLIEEKRTYRIPIFENENGIYCFRNYNISLLKEINNLSFLKYAFFESITIDDETLFNVLSTYKKVINNELSITQGEDVIKSLSLDIEDGFSYDDTVYVKEKIVQ